MLSDFSARNPRSLSLIPFLASALVLFVALLASSLRAAPVTLEEFASSSLDGPSLVEAVDQARHAVRPVEGVVGQWWAQNPANSFNARFTPEGLVMSVAVSSRDGRARHLSTLWRTVGVGYGENLVPVGEGEVSVSAEPGRVEIARPGLVEWFVNRKEGLEHGWTLSERSVGEDGIAPLRLEMALEGDLLAEVSGDGRYVVLRDPEGGEALRYEKLKVWDAEGREMASRMVGSGKSLTVEVEDTGAVYPLTIDPLFTQQKAYLKASNTGADDQFGYCVAISGDTIVVSAPGEDSVATGVDGDQGNNSSWQAGAVYVFVRSGASWTQQAYLKASNTGEGDSFGTSVAISGDTIVVGADYEDSNAVSVDGDQSDDSAPESGAAYVFVRSGTSWTQQAYLKASNAEAGDQFGYSVAVSGDTVVVGARGESSAAIGVDGNPIDNTAPFSGAAYVFVRSGTSWIQQAYLKASNTEAGDQFGHSVMVSGDTIVVGAPGEDSSVDGDQGNNSAWLAGAAYVFVRSGTDWIQQAYLKASTTGWFDNFGYSVAVSGDTVVVGARGESSAAIGVDGDQSDDSAPESGAAYVFVRGEAGWTQQAYLKASNTGEGDWFGHRVAVSGDTVVVGARYEASVATGVDGDQSDDSAPESGAAYVFVRGETGWTQQAYLKASNMEDYDLFGWSVAVSGDTIVVGADGEASAATGVNGNQSNNSASSSGAAYVFLVGEGPVGGLSVDPVSRTASAEGGSYSFLVTTTGDWSWSVDGGTGWFSSDEAADQSGNQTFSYTVATNASPSSRVATVTLTSGSLSETHTITQSAALPVRMLLQKPKAFPATRTGKKSRAQTLRVTNGGGSPLTGLRVSTSGRAKGDFLLAQPARKTLAPGAATTFKATFRPKAKGVRKATLEVRSNAPLVKAPLSGKGKAR